MADIFISHASEDAATARDVCAALEATGVSCWIAPRDIRPGEDYRSEILRGVRESASLLLLYSPHASRSEHVAREVGLADEGNKPIYPLRIDTNPLEGPLAYVLQGKQWVDFRANPAAAVSSISTALRGKAPDQAPKIRGRFLGLPARAWAGVGIAAALLVVAGLGWSYFTKASRQGATILACQNGALSELELTIPRGVTPRPFGMIQPQEALSACIKAVKLRPNDAALKFALFRAKAAASPADIAGTPVGALTELRAAADAGDPEAVFVLKSIAHDRDELGLPEPSDEAISAMQQTLITAQQAGNPRAAYLLSQMTLPMCASSDDPTKIPNQSEAPLFAWVKAKFVEMHADKAAVAAAADTKAFTDAAEANFCTVLDNYLIAQASAGGVLGAQFQMADDLGDNESDAPALEPRGGPALKQALLDAHYAPAEMYYARNAFECKDDNGNPKRATPAEFAPLEQIADRGFRPAMAFVGGLIVSGCAPQDRTYPQALRWFERASEGMEAQQ